jgi:hypothetical protein
MEYRKIDHKWRAEILPRIAREFDHMQSEIANMQDISREDRISTQTKTTVHRGDVKKLDDDLPRSDLARSGSDVRYWDVVKRKDTILWYLDEVRAVMRELRRRCEWKKMVEDEGMCLCMHACMHVCMHM